MCFLLTPSRIGFLELFSMSTVFLSSLSVSQKHRDKSGFFLYVVLILSSSLSIKQGADTFLQSTQIVMGGGERKAACYWVLSVLQVPSHVLSFTLPSDNVGQSVLSFYRQVISWGQQ